MNHLDEMREKRPAKLKTYVECRHNVVAVLVVEGRDDSALYSRAFESVVPGIQSGQLRVIICNGKYPVLDFRESLRQEFPNDTKAMFFVDRDHDDFLGRDCGDERAYVTDYYSIEWDFCTGRVMGALIARHYALSGSDPIWKIIHEKFPLLMQSWMDCSMPVMRALIAAKKRGRKLIPENICLSDICRLNSDRYESTGKNIESLLIQAGCEKIPDPETLSEDVGKLPDVDERMYIRGKLAVQFCRQFHDQLGEIYGNPRKVDGECLPTPIPVGKKNFVRFISHDWDIPDSLKDFFRKWEQR